MLLLSDGGAAGGGAGRRWRRRRCRRHRGRRQQCGQLQVTRANPYASVHRDYGQWLDRRAGQRGTTQKRTHKCLGVLFVRGHRFAIGSVEICCKHITIYDRTTYENNTTKQTNIGCTQRDDEVLCVKEWRASEEL